MKLTLILSALVAAVFAQDVPEICVYLAEGCAETTVLTPCSPLGLGLDCKKFEVNSSLQGMMQLEPQIAQVGYLHDGRYTLTIYNSTDCTGSSFINTVATLNECQPLGAGHLSLKIKMSKTSPATTTAAKKKNASNGLAPTLLSVFGVLLAVLLN